MEILEANVMLDEGIMQRETKYQQIMDKYGRNKLKARYDQGMIQSGNEGTHAAIPEFHVLQICRDTMTHFELSLISTILASGLWLAQLAVSFPLIRVGCFIILLGYFIFLACDASWIEPIFLPVENATTF
jgi:hypothetical protein